MPYRCLQKTDFKREKRITRPIDLQIDAEVARQASTKAQPAGPLSQDDSISYDRILERCAPSLFAGKNFREENAGATKQAAKDIVNRKHE